MLKVQVNGPLLKRERGRERGERERGGGGECGWVRGGGQTGVGYLGEKPRQPVEKSEAHNVLLEMNIHPPRPGDGTLTLLTLVIKFVGQNPPALMLLLI